MATFVLGDIHGNFKGMRQAIARSPFDAKKDILITLGDYVDGGQHIEVLPVIDYLLALPNWTGLIGNHDKMMMEAMSGNDSHRKVWLEQGGQNTLNALDKSYKFSAHGLSFNPAVKVKLIRFTEQLKLYHIDDNGFVYVHAGWQSGFERIEDSASMQNNPEDLSWDRTFWNSALQESFIPPPYEKVFIGHSYSLSHPSKRHNIWNIDSGGGHNGCITLMNVLTEEYWQSEPTAELYENFSPRR